MGDDAAPASYLTLEPGIAVRSRDGVEVGTVAHVLAVPEEDIFDGLVIAIDGGHRFVDAPQVAELREDAVILSIDADDCRRLPEPSESPAALSADPDDVAGSDLQSKLRRAWDLISGRY
jgi:hypothetical protein